MLTRIAAGLITVCVAAVGQARPEFGTPVRFSGICDASAAVIRGSEVLILNDEDSVVTVFRTYRLTGGAPIRELTLNSSGLSLDVREAEIDIEAVAAAGNLLYVTGSHGRNKNAKARVSRQRLFALPWPLKVAAAPEGVYTTLLLDAQARLKQDRKPELSQLLLDNGKSPSMDGASIEGMAATRSGGLLIGFRSPLAGGKALIMELTNPRDAIRRQPAKFGQVHTVDLEGHAVRDLLWDAHENAFWILSGPVLHDGTFGLYRWKPGSDQDKPTPVVRRQLKDLGIDPAASAEAIAWEDGHTALWIFFDEGDTVVGGKDCKVSAAPGFRGVRVTGLSSLLTPPARRQPAP